AHVEGELDRLAGDGVFAALFAAEEVAAGVARGDAREAAAIGTQLWPARGELRDDGVAVLAVEGGLVFAFDAVAAEEVAKDVALVFEVGEFGIVDLAEVAEDLSGGGAEVVAALRADDGDYAGKRMRVFLDARALRLGDVFLHHDLFEGFALFL